MGYFLDRIFDFIAILFVLVIFISMVASTVCYYFEREENISKKIGIIQLNGGQNDARDRSGQKYFSSSLEH